MRHWAVQGALIVLGTLVLLEVALQVAGLVLGDLPRWGRGGEAAEIRILCVGDSHTFGAMVPLDQSYPAQLERLLKSRYPDRRIRVDNLGIPGVNTAYVANRLETQILELAPDVLIVWVGVNDRWNSLEMDTAEADGCSGALRRALLQLKLFRVASVIWYGRQGRRYAESVRTSDLPVLDGPTERRRGPAERIGNAAAQRSVASGLRRMIRQSRSLGVPVILVDYPWYFYGYASRAIRETGESLGVPVVDTGKLHEQAVADGHSPEDLVVRGAGPHPTGVLYGYVSEALLPLVAKALAESRGIEPVDTGLRTGGPPSR